MSSKFLNLSIVFLCLFFISCATHVPPVKIPPELPSLAQEVNKISQRAGCRLGIAAIHLESGRKFEWNDQEKFEAASVIKIAILAEALSRWREGKLDLNERWILNDSEKAAGSGILEAFDSGLQPTKRDLLRMMIIVSDNTATNYWIDQLGAKSINSRMASLGLSKIRLLGRIPDKNPEDTQDQRWNGLKLGEVTPHEVAEYFRLLVEGKLLDPEATRLAREIFSQQYVSRIPKRLLDEDNRTWEGKTGTMSNTRLDSGILTTPKGRFVLAIFADRIPDRKDAAEDAVAAIADAAYAIVHTWEESLPTLPATH